MKSDNPFTLTFGRQPITSIARLKDTNQIAGSFSANNPICQTYLISGLHRGLLVSREYGTLELTLPRFGRFAKLLLKYEEE